ncbi:MAG: DinB family protein [Bacteroidota bacterium]
MSTCASLRRRFRYHQWATQTLIEAAAQTDASEVRRPLGHALIADRVWLLRLRSEPTEGTALWPDLEIEGCRALARRNADGYTAALDTLSEADLDATVAYQNSSGRTYATAIRDVLDHVLLHASHHRGQVNAALRAAGADPPWVDFIAWVRAGEPGA